MTSEKPPSHHHAAVGFTVQIIFLSLSLGIGQEHKLRIEALWENLEGMKNKIHEGERIQRIYTSELLMFPGAFPAT